MIGQMGGVLHCDSPIAAPAEGVAPVLIVEPRDSLEGLWSVTIEVVGVYSPGGTRYNVHCASGRVVLLLGHRPRTQGPSPAQHARQHGGGGAEGMHGRMEVEGPRACTAAWRWRG